MCCVAGEERAMEKEKRKAFPTKTTFVSFAVLPQPLSSCGRCPTPTTHQTHRINLSHRNPVLSHSRLGTDRLCYLHPAISRS